MCVRGTNSFGELFVGCLIIPSLCLDELVYSPLSILACDHIRLTFGATLEKSSGDEEVTVLAPLHQTPSQRIALLLAARECDEKVNLIAGYTITYGVVIVDIHIIQQSLFSSILDISGG